MQLLDVSFMLPFKTYYAQEIESRLRMDPTGVVTYYQIAGLLGKAYLKGVTVGVAVNGFRRTGLFPYNRHIFHEYQNMSGCEETEHALPGPSDIVQPPVASVTVQTEKRLHLSLRCLLISVLFQTSVKQRLTMLLKDADHLDVMPLSCYQIQLTRTN
jgi:hypothetical protein